MDVDDLERAKQIAEAEHLSNGQGIEAYTRLARACSNNMRAMLTKIESGVMLDDDGGRNAASPAPPTRNGKASKPSSAALAAFIDAVDTYEGAAIDR